MSDRVKVPYEEAVAMLPKSKTIHTFLNPAVNVLVGADWERDSILNAFRKYGVELSGEEATKTNHGLCFKRETGWVFVETKSNEAP